MRSCRRGHIEIHGAALPLVLWAVFVMSITLVVVIKLVDFDLDLEGLGARRFSARQLALSGFALAAHPKIKRGDPLLFQTFPDGSRQEVLILSEDARININELLAGSDITLLTKLFRFWGANEKQAAAVVDALKDWTDSDEFRSLNGAEPDDLANQTEYSRPENRPFLRVSEMSTVKGMDVISRIKPDWAEFFSIRSSKRLDLQDVSSDLLQVFGGLSLEQAESFVRYRKGPDGREATADDVEIKSVMDVVAVVSPNEPQVSALNASFGSGGGTRRIISRGYCGGLVYEIVAICIGNANSGCLEWIER